MILFIQNFIKILIHSQTHQIIEYIYVCVCVYMLHNIKYYKNFYLAYALIHTNDILIKSVTKT